MTRHEDLRRYLQLNADFAKRHGYASLEALVLEHGKEYEWKPLPDGFECGYSKECYGNATNAVLDLDPERYRYCEGFADGGMVPCKHAWIVDLEDRKAIDVTWRDGGKECGFCLGTGVTVDDDADSDTYMDEETCFWCKGSGENEYEHPSREGAVYLGVEMETDWVCKTIMRKGTYGVLEEWAQELEGAAA